MNTCQTCGTENGAEFRFCLTCGAKLEQSCAQCGAALPPDAQFCGHCGSRLSADAAPTIPEPNLAPSHPTMPPRRTMPERVGSGRYAVKSFLGEGGRKRVYLAHDARLDRDVAVGVMYTEGLDVGARQRIQREAQAMGRLGDHPHIVTVFDIGEEQDQVYIVSEYMSGGDLAALLRDAPDGRLSIENTLRMAEQVCAALEHAHARDIIHRDLKPGNVWLGPDGTARLGDFGLALDLERSRITQDGMMVGTVAYMPPEQALGRAPDPRSDLYALGAMLYEMVTGRTLFQGDDAVTIISQHINTPPVRPRFLNPQVPPGLETLILGLLEKAPEDRPASAAAVRRRLQQIAADSSELVAAASVQLPQQATNRLAWGRFIGRVEELGQLKQALDGALDGRGCLRMVVGEPGIGKTRTTDELATYAQLRGAQVLIGRCYEGEGAPAYWPWVQIIRDHTYERDEKVLRSEMGPGAADIAEVVSDVRHRLPDLPKPADLEPEQARFRLFDSITSFLKNAARTKPLMLILDDLHWADKPSLLLLQFLARELAGSTLLVVGTYRDVELDRKHPLSEVLGELRRDRLYERVLLRGWTVEEITQLLGSLSQQEMQEAGRQLAAALHRETEGNPFFCEEIIQHLVESGALYRGEDGLWTAGNTSIEDLGIPQGVREVIGRRLSHLSNECNDVLTVGAVIGRDFDLKVLQRVCELDGDALYKGLDEAETSGLAREDPNRRAIYRFSHALIRETLYEELSTPRRVRLHRAVGQALEAIHADDIDVRLAEVAHHFFEGVQGGGDVATAVDYCVRAAERARAQVAHEEAALHYERALQAMEFDAAADQTRRCELLIALSNTRMDAGDREGARHAGGEAAEAARHLDRPELVARAALAHATYTMSLGYADRAVIALLDDALDALGAEDSRLRVEVLLRLARELVFGGDRERRAALLAEAEGIASRLGDAKALLMVKGEQGWTEQDPSQAQDALRRAQEGLELARETGDLGAQLQILNGIVMHAGTLGEFEVVKQAHAGMDELADRHRLSEAQWLRVARRAGAAIMAGKLDEAEELAQTTRTMGQRVNPELALQTFTVHKYFLARTRGRFEEHVPLQEEMVERFGGLGLWQSSLARTYMEAGRREEARAIFEEYAADGFEGFRRGILPILGWSNMTVLCVAFQDRERAAILYDLLRPYAGMFGAAGGSGTITGSVTHMLGVLASLREEWDVAAGHYEGALAELERLGSPFLLAFARADYAQMLLKRGRPQDRARAMELANLAASTAQETGMQGALEQALAVKLELQGVPSSSGHHHTVDMIAATVEVERPDIKQHAAPDGTVTILFSDIEGFTAMTERLGDVRVQEVLREHNRIVRDQVRAHSGYEVKAEGDGFMLAFGSARKAINCAVAIQRELDTGNSREGWEPVRVRMGLHTGEVIKEADDFFGKNVILAARIASQARGGEILVSALVKKLTESAGDLTFDDARTAELKGLTGQHSLYPVTWC